MIDEGYKKLEIYQLSHSLSIKVHEMTMTLPKFEMYEEGSQIRRSAKSAPANIVEGYCLRKHKNEFLLYLNRSYASAEETIEHLEILFETKSLANAELFRELRDAYETLCKKTFRFMQGVSQSHDKPFYLKEGEVLYGSESGNP